MLASIQSPLAEVIVPKTDEYLLQKIIRQDDYGAFEELFHRYYQALCLQVNSRVGYLQATEEIVSDVFTKIWRNRANISITTKVKYYLYTAVRNQSIDYLRKQTKQRNYKHEINRDYPSNFASPEELIIGEELRIKIEAAIEQLPPKAKHIFRKSRDEGKKYREIAEELNISIRTVETHIRRALIALRGAVFTD
ncbi:MAG: RNA polymerase sigma-70 factor [Bacteroidota bacterium]